MELFRVFGSILIKDNDAEKKIDKVDKKAESLGSKLKKMGGTVAKWGAGLTGAAGVAVGGMVALSTKIGNIADGLLDLNSITGMSTDEIQKWQKATKVAGVSADAVTNAAQKLTLTLDTMERSGGKGAATLEKLGLSVEDITKMNADERMNAITQALASVEDKTERARLGTDLFGKSWANLAPIVDLGVEGLQKAKESANVFSNDDLQKANNFRIAMEEIKDRVGFLFMELGMKLLPITQNVVDFIAQNMPGIQATVDTVFNAVGNIITWVIDNAISPLLSWFGNLKGDAEGLGETLNNIFISLFGEKVGGKLMEFVDNIIPAFQEAFTIITDVVMPRVYEAFNYVKDAILPPVIEIFEFIINEIVPRLAKSFEEWIPVIVQILQDFWATAKVIFDYITKYIEWALPYWKSIFMTIFTAMQGIVSAALLIIKGIINTVLGILTGDWEKAWNGIKDIFEGIWEGIKSIVSGAVEFVTKTINGMIDGIKKALDYINIFNKKKVDKKDVSINNTEIAGARADGGRVLAGKSYLVGERGMEIFTPSQNGYIIPNHQLGANTVTNNFNINNMRVRNDNDITLIARELYNLQKNAQRGVGLVTP